MTFARRRADQFRTLDGQNGDDLLYADFGFAAGNQLCHRFAGEFSFRSHLFGDAEFFQERRGKGAAWTIAIGK